MINIPGYRFKKMIGDRDKRPPYHGHWYRWSTNGFGIEDFLQFCEKAGFTAAFAVNIEETPQDMADMIEYLNGPVTSEWGRRRAENGHPEPYGVKYIGIGNEEVLFNGDRADEYDHYVERFNLLHDAIKGKDPSVKLISTAWWRADSPSMERTFRALDGKADYWDYHPWADQLASGREVEAELRRMRELFLRWNPSTTMKCAIFEENGNRHDMQRVLGHVTLQNAVRRMGDFVLTSCAANALQPYRQNDNGWDQGQVFFTPSQVWGMPPLLCAADGCGTPPSPDGRLRGRGRRRGARRDGNPQPRGGERRAPHRQYGCRAAACGPARGRDGEGFPSPHGFALGRPRRGEHPRRAAPHRPRRAGTAGPGCADCRHSALLLYDRGAG